MSVAEAQRRISSREFAEWMRYYDVEPFGESRADLRNGITAAVIANVNRAKGATAYKPKDFMPRFEVEQQSGAEIRARLEAWTAAIKARDRGKQHSKSISTDHD